MKFFSLYINQNLKDIKVNKFELSSKLTSGSKLNVHVSRTNE